MSRLHALAASAVLTALVLAGCGTEEDPEPVASSPTSSPTPTETATVTESPSPTETTTPTPTPAETTPAPAPAKFARPVGAVKALIAARQADDRQAAARAATPGTVKSVFAEPAPLGSPTVRCFEGDSTYAWDCAFLDKQGSWRYLVNPDPATGWRVEQFSRDM